MTDGCIETFKVNDTSSLYNSSNAKPITIMKIIGICSNSYRVQMKRAAVNACPILSKAKKISSGKGSGNADSELNARILKEGSVKTKTFRKDDSVSLIQQDPVNDRAEHFCHFYGKDSPFSNFQPAKFVLDGVQYNCSEQYMMYQKARYIDMMFDRTLPLRWYEAPTYCYVLHIEMNNEMKNKIK